MVDYAGLVSHLSQDKAPFALLTMQATATAGVLMRSFPERFKSLFSAEHGFFGIVAPGEKTGADNHPYWKLPIHSLYGEHRHPTPEMLEGIDVMVYDLQDVGARSYTFISTLGLVMEACAAEGVEVMVLDRPNPQLTPPRGVATGATLESSQQVPHLRSCCVRRVQPPVDL